MESVRSTIWPSVGERTPAHLRRWSDLPLFHAAWLFALGIVFAKLLWWRPSFLLLGWALMAVFSIVAAVRAQRVAWLAMAPLWVVLGAWCAEMEPQPAPEPVLSALSDGLLRTVEGTVVEAGPVRGEIEEDGDESTSSPLPEKPSQRIDLRVSSIEKVTDEEDAQVPAGGAVRLTVRWPSLPAQPFRCGDSVRAVVRLLPPEVFRDPGVWSLRDYLLDLGITSTGSVDRERVEQRGDAPLPGGGWREAVQSIHCRLSEAQRTASNRLLALPAATRSLPRPLRISEDDAIMLAAMVTGDRTFLSRRLRVGFERTGSFHMLVVSGFHLAIVSGCIFWIARRLRLPRVPATLLTIIASFAYALFTGFAVPVQRSLWMVTLYLLGCLVYRERSPMNTIGFAALCLLAASPRSLFESGFQMTLLAVAAIGGIAMPLLESTIHPYLAATRDLGLVAIDPKLPPRHAEFRVILRMAAARLEAAFHRVIAWRVFPWIVRSALRVCELVVVAVVVELAMTLPMAIYFHRITIFALPVNLLILPLLALLMPAAVITLIALLIWPAMAAIPAAVVAVLLHFGVRLVRLFGALALGDLRIPGPLVGQSAMFCILLGAAMVLARGAKWQRRAAWAALAAGALAAVAPRPIQHPRDALLVEAIDVGQGDSLLLITPDGKTLLVDGGGLTGGAGQGSYQRDENRFAGNRAPQEFDIGEEVVAPALWARGIRRLDAVALSHAHSDHMGGLPAVLRNFRPKELWVGNNPHTESYDALLREAAELGVQTRPLRGGDTVAFGVAQVNVLAPPLGYQPGSAPANNDSLVLRVAYGNTSVLLEGDAEAPVEEALINQAALESTLLKVGHHGSLTSTRPEFLARVAPQWAVISCGLHNRFGHPRPEILAELEQARVRTFSTDINGATCFRLDGKEAAELSCETDLIPNP
ncbi:MAG TPA: ComEC/Rec2 family competence protein [Candidatus Sulfopaludibacter sp.]|nr:ComEC/Rec2 family competence protein [Candidatus Sulfopaludibacter sp.]